MYIYSYTYVYFIIVISNSSRSNLIAQEHILKLWQIIIFASNWIIIAFASNWIITSICVPVTIEFEAKQLFGNWPCGEYFEKYLETWFYEH